MRLASRGRRQRRRARRWPRRARRLRPWRACRRARPPPARAAVARRPARRPRRCSRTPAGLRCRARSRAGSTATRGSSRRSRSPPCGRVSGSATANRSPPMRLTSASAPAACWIEVADALNHLVAGAQAERFVDRRELVDVDVQHCRRARGRARVARAARRSSGSASPVSESYSLPRIATALRLTNSRIRTSRGSKSSASRARNSATSPSTPPRGSRSGHERILYGARSPARLTTIGRLLSRAHASRCFCVRSSSCVAAAIVVGGPRELEILVRHQQRARHAAELAARSGEGARCSALAVLAIVLVDAEQEIEPGAAIGGERAVLEIELCSSRQSSTGRSMLTTIDGVLRELRRRRAR